MEPLDRQSDRLGDIERSPERIALVVDDKGTPLVGARALRGDDDVPEGRAEYVRADVHRGAVEENKRLRAVLQTISDRPGTLSSMRVRAAQALDPPATERR